jgi:hypothetical protein
VSESEAYAEVAADVAVVEVKADARAEEPFDDEEEEVVV